MLSLRELLAYGKAFMEEDQQDSGGEYDLQEGFDRQEHCERIYMRETMLETSESERYLPGSTPHLTRVLSPPFVSSSSPSSSISSTPTVLQSRLANPYLQLDNAASISKAAKSNPYLEKFSSNTSSQPMSRPVYLCEQHRKQRIMIEVTGAPDEDEAVLEERRGNSTERLLMPDVASSSCRSFTSEGTQTEARVKKRGERKEEKAREKEERRRQKEEVEAEQYRKLSVQEAAYRKLSQQYEEQLNYGMDSMSLDSGEDSKADDMDEMTMPNPGSIQHFERLFYPSIPCKNCSTCYVKYEQEIFGS